MTFYRRVRMIVRIIIFLSSPFFFSWFTHSFPASSEPSRPFPDWLPMARGAMWFMVLLFTLAPFYFERLYMGVAEPYLRARGRDPEDVGLWQGIVMGGMGPMIAFILFVFGSEPGDVYATSAIAVVNFGFWTYRYRNVFQSLV